MKSYCLLLSLVLAVEMLSAAITPFIQLETGHFAGKTATYASGDTIALV